MPQKNVSNDRITAVLKQNKPERPVASIKYPVQGIGLQHVYYEHRLRIDDKNDIYNVSREEMIFESAVSMSSPKCNCCFGKGVKTNLLYSTKELCDCVFRTVGSHCIYQHWNFIYSGCFNLGTGKTKIEWDVDFVKTAKNSLEILFFRGFIEKDRYDIMKVLLRRCLLTRECDVKEIGAEFFGERYKRNIYGFWEDLKECVGHGALTKSPRWLYPIKEYIVGTRTDEILSRIRPTRTQPAFEVYGRLRPLVNRNSLKLREVD